MGIKEYRAYDELWEFNILNVDDEYHTWLVPKDYPMDQYNAQNYGPIFPYIIDADFSSYEGFRKFTNLFGLQGFAKLSKNLESILNIAKSKQEPISRSALKGVFKEIRLDLKKEQRGITLFFETYKQGLSNKDFVVLTSDQANMTKEAVIAADKSIASIDTKLRINRNGRSITSGESIFTAKDLIDINYLRDEQNDIDKLQDSKVTDLYEDKNIYPTIFSRCYLEIKHLIKDNKEIKKCLNCGMTFVPSRANEAYCSRLDPKVAERLRIDTKANAMAVKGSSNKDVPLNLGLDNFNFYRITSNLYKTCKKLGPRKKWESGLSGKKLEFVSERKKKLNRLTYLKKKLEAGKLEEADYQKALSEYEDWKLKNKS